MSGKPLWATEAVSSNPAEHDGFTVFDRRAGDTSRLKSSNGITRSPLWAGGERTGPEANFHQDKFVAGDLRGNSKDDRHGNLSRRNRRTCRAM